MKQRLTEEQIIKILEEARGGLTVALLSVVLLCRKHAIAPATYYKWKAKFNGMTVADARRLKVLEKENSKLKRLVAEYALDIAALKDVASKK